MRNESACDFLFSDNCIEPIFPPFVEMAGKILREKWWQRGAKYPITERITDPLFAGQNISSDWVRAIEKKTTSGHRRVDFESPFIFLHPHFSSCISQDSGDIKGTVLYRDFAISWVSNFPRKFATISPRL